MGLESDARAVVMAAYDALNGTDWDEFLGLLDPDVEWTTTEGYVEPGTYRGRDGVRAYLEPIYDEFEDMRVRASNVIAEGDAVLLDHHLQGTGKRSGAQVDLSFSVLVEVRAGKVARLRNFERREDAEVALGSLRDGRGRGEQ